MFALVGWVALRPHAPALALAELPVLAALLLRTRLATHTGSALNISAAAMRLRSSPAGRASRDPSYPFRVARQDHT